MTHTHLVCAAGDHLIVQVNEDKEMDNTENRGSATTEQSRGGKKRLLPWNAGLCASCCRLVAVDSV